MGSASAAPVALPYLAQGYGDLETCIHKASLSDAVLSPFCDLVCAREAHVQGAGRRGRRNRGARESKEMQWKHIPHQPSVDPSTASPHPTPACGEGRHGAGDYLEAEETGEGGARQHCTEARGGPPGNARGSDARAPPQVREPRRPNVTTL